MRFITTLYESAPELRAARALAKAFYTTLNEKKNTSFLLWLTKDEMSGVAELKRITTSTEGDYATVGEALSSPRSNGLVENHVHPLNMLKRQIYGRAGFVLLQRQVLNPLA